MSGYYVLENKLCESVFIGNGCKPTSSLDNALEFSDELSADWFRKRYVKDGYKYKTTLITPDDGYYYTAEKAFKAGQYIERYYHQQLDCAVYCSADVEASKEALNALYGRRMITEYFPGYNSYSLNFAIKKVIFNDPATIVLWKDGSKTVVKAQDGETYDPEKGLAMAISKKALGNQGNYYDVFKEHLPKEESKDTGNIDKWWGVEAYPIKKGKDKAYRCSNCNRFISNETVKLTRLNILSPCPHCGKLIGPSSQEG